MGLSEIGWDLSLARTQDNCLPNLSRAQIVGSLARMAGLSGGSLRSCVYMVAYVAHCECRQGWRAVRHSMRCTAVRSTIDLLAPGGRGVCQNRAEQGRRWAEAGNVQGRILEGVG